MRFLGQIWAFLGQIWTFSAALTEPKANFGPISHKFRQFPTDPDDFRPILTQIPPFSPQFFWVNFSPFSQLRSPSPPAHQGAPSPPPPLFPTLWFWGWKTPFFPGFPRFWGEFRRFWGPYRDKAVGFDAVDPEPVVLEPPRAAQQLLQLPQREGTHLGKGRGQVRWAWPGEGGVTG